MSLFQCGHCGCKENTALSHQGCDGFTVNWYTWNGIEDRKGKKLCSACGPTMYKDGTLTGLGKWHGEFERKFLPMGQYRTGRSGNLELIPGSPANGAASTKSAVRPCQHDLLRPDTTVVADGRFDAKCSACGEEWHIPHPPENEEKTHGG